MHSPAGESYYQIYPNTFNEERPNGEPHIGRGSLRGITAKRDYLKDLGVENIWISPFYPSPGVDAGYDISDYTNVDPALGTLADFDELITNYHEAGIGVMVDLVPNHTSDQHEWFKEAISSPDNPKRDWYIWHAPGPDGGPPNNWSSVFSIPNLRKRQRGELQVPDGENTPPVSAWRYDETSGQYYLCDFAAEQPNLNWANPEVRDAIKEVMRFWLRRGVDGFRVDVANHLGKDPQFRNEEPNPNYMEGIDNPHDQHKQFYSLNYPDTLYPYLEELTSVMTEPEFAERQPRMVLECWMAKDDLKKVDQVAPGVATSFNFTRLRAPWSAPLHGRLLKEYYEDLPAKSTGNQVLSNHDVERVASRIGSKPARAAAVLNLSLPRTDVFIYNGEEGGFPHAYVPPELRRDNELGERDGARLPMLWNDQPNAGFSQASPDKLWLPVDPDYPLLNLEAQRHDPHSFHALYKALLRVRKLPAIRYGNYHPLPTSNPNVLAFASRFGREQTITTVNFNDEPLAVRIFNTQQNVGRSALSSFAPHEQKIVTFDDYFTLRENEAIVSLQTA